MQQSDLKFKSRSFLTLPKATPLGTVNGAVNGSIQGQSGSYQDYSAGYTPWTQADGSVGVNAGGVSGGVDGSYYMNGGYSQDYYGSGYASTGWNSGVSYGRGRHHCHRSHRICRCLHRR